MALRALGFEMKKTDVQKLMNDYDVENTGKITIHDFMEICNNILSNTEIHFQILIICSSEKAKLVFVKESVFIYMTSIISVQ